MVDPPPMFAARNVAKSSPGPSRRPATKKSAAPLTRRAIHTPSAICADEYRRMIRRYARRPPTAMDVSARDLGLTN
jgi:hypothetical protein